ncbi:MBL fold metallo-hydrolase [Olivibacter sp. SDN3]|uniref:MBL fold metallo-hydrolase n=1 Tax=Olivibacter sp. SDN3 TaxID=2764720 RepID=UPI001650FD69|nr:MBL fold metallo-hydrolase [Olivibacter sp. SDN3]QNL47855.1 MBL fold metallo-hydrolase [Olivibacter sp. SDN3]
MGKISSHNPNLAFIKEGWTGNPISTKDSYENLDGTSVRSLRELLQWVRGERPLAKLKKNQKSALSFTPTTNIGDKTIDCMIPIGHAGFVFDVGGVRIVIDPILHNSTFLKRFTQVPFSPSELTGVDYLLLSHNHRDHIDKKTVKLLTALNPTCKILTGLETGKLLRSWNISNEIEEAGWFQRYNTTKDVIIDYLPSKHWSRRWLTDTNINLWGSFMIQFTKLKKTVYFGSDSGYGVHFELIGELYDIDLAILGIGAYEPQWFMHTGHMGPKDALIAFADLKAKTLMPMHYGTFDLSDEPVYYPEKILRELNADQRVTIRWMEIGKRMEV